MSYQQFFKVMSLPQTPSFQQYNYICIKYCPVVLDHLRFATAIVALIPLIIYFYRNHQITFINRKYLVISFLFVLFAIIRMQIFANLLVALLMILLSMQRTSRLKQTAFYIGLVLFLLVLVPNQVYYDAFIISSSYFDPQSNLHFKLVDMALFLVETVLKELPQDIGIQDIQICFMHSWNHHFSGFHF